MGYISGMNRDQMWLFPERVDASIEENNPVRFIEAYIDTLNLAALGFTHAVPKDTGRPPYTPADMWTLYIDGYLNQIRSRRTLA